MWAAVGSGGRIGEDIGEDGKLGGKSGWKIGGCGDQAVQAGQACECYSDTAIKKRDCCQSRFSGAEGDPRAQADVQAKF
ncbi:hypothetical protein AZSI13_01010 [Azospira sp. I13]|nr:hypothetical protein AZSI13_01010 [Azospira sp. I13]